MYISVEAHHQKFAGHLEVELPHQFDIFNEQRRHFGQVDGIDVCPPPS